MDVYFEVRIRFPKTCGTGACNYGQNTHTYCWRSPLQTGPVAWAVLGWCFQPHWQKAKLLSALQSLSRHQMDPICEDTPSVSLSPSQHLLIATGLSLPASWTALLSFNISSSFISLRRDFPGCLASSTLGHDLESSANPCFGPWGALVCSSPARFVSIEPSVVTKGHFCLMDALRWMINPFECMAWTNLHAALCRWAQTSLYISGSSQQDVMAIPTAGVPQLSLALQAGLPPASSTLKSLKEH